VLREAGVASAFLHGGTSSVVAIGAPPGEAGWRVAIRDPRGGPAVATVALCDEALGVSAPHGRIAACGAGHVLDPRSGQPVARGSLAAVVHDTATLADAWSTALLVDPAAGCGGDGPAPASGIIAGLVFAAGAEKLPRCLGDRRRFALESVPCP
jgi:thiamine biosynthesis lipoprotein